MRKDDYENVIPKDNYENVGRSGRKGGTTRPRVYLTTDRVLRFVHV